MPSRRRALLVILALALLGLASLLVRIGNSAAQNLYRAMGFTIVEIIPGYYADREDGVLMHLLLPGTKKT